MRLSAVHNSRVTFLIEIAELTPFGKVHPPTLLNALAKRCDFKNFPENLGKEPKPQAFVFEGGLWNKQPITKLSLFNDGIALDTGSSTEDTETTLLELLEWAKRDLGLAFEPAMVRRKMLLSQLVFYMEGRLDSVHPIFGEMEKVLSQSTSENLNHPFSYRIASVQLSPNPLDAKFLPGLFSIERRADTPDSENKYFSTAPVHTKEHLALLERFERSIRK